MRTSPIASRSDTADDVAPRIFAHCATCQSHSETNGPQTDRAAVSSFDCCAMPGIGEPALPNGKRSITTVDDLSALGALSGMGWSIGPFKGSAVVSTAHQFGMVVLG